MEKLKIAFTYEVNGKTKNIEFCPVSYSKLVTKEFTFGVPQRIKRIVECKSFKFLDVQCRQWDGLTLQFSGTGYSINGHNLFFHYKTIVKEALS